MAETKKRGRLRKTSSPLTTDVFAEAKAIKEKKIKEGLASKPLTTSEDDPINAEVFKCTMCGKHKKFSDFYLNTRSEVFKGNNYRMNVCSECLNGLFEKFSKDYGDERIATLVCSHIADVPYVETLCDRVMELNAPTFGKYLKYLNVRQYEERSYSKDLIQNFNAAEREELYANNLKTWNQNDLKNKVRVVKALGNDPFEDCKDEDRRYMFNLCSEYFMDESLLDDPHKTQGVVEIIKTYKDIRNIDRLIDGEIRNGSSKNGTINEAKLSKLTSTKKDLMDLINKFAKDNGIATLNAKATKGTSSLAYYIKLLDEIDFTEAKVNLFDIATCDGMRQVADISNQSIWNQIQLSDDEKDELLLTQSKELTATKRELQELKEQFRKHKLKYSKYEEIEKIESDNSDNTESVGD